MRLNTIKAAHGAKKKRVRIGRGIGSGLGKTCGYGHKGQKARSGYHRKRGFEGGQMPLQRRLPKFGFTSLKSCKAAEIQLRDLNKIKTTRIDLIELKKANLVNKNIKYAKVILAGNIDRAVTLIGIRATSGAKQAIEKAGGRVE